MLRIKLFYITLQNFMKKLLMRLNTCPSELLSSTQVTCFCRGVFCTTGAEALVTNSLVSDGCIIEGEVKNCVLASDVRIAPGAKIENCILMRGAKIGAGVILNSVIADKYASVSAFRTLMGSEKLPIVIPKNSNI